MQLAERFRRGIVVPLDVTACGQLLQGKVDENTSVQSINLDNDDTFYELWEWGFFKAINQACETHIGEYEDNCLPGHNLAAFQAVIQAFLEKSECSVARREVLLECSNLSETALKLKAPVFFIL